MRSKHGARCRHAQFVRPFYLPGNVGLEFSYCCLLSLLADQIGSGGHANFRLSHCQGSRSAGWTSGRYCTLPPGAGTGAGTVERTEVTQTYNTQNAGTEISVAPSFWPVAVSKRNTGHRGVTEPLSLSLPLLFLHRREA